MAGVGDASFAIDYKDAFRPAGVQIVHSVTHGVDGAWDGQLKLRAALPGDIVSLGRRNRVVEDHLIGLVGRDLPSILRVRFPDVDHQERGPVAVGSVHLLESANLAPKRRSGKAPEDEHERSILLEGTSRYDATAIQKFEREVRRDIAHRRCRPGHQPARARPIGWLLFRGHPADHFDEPWGGVTSLTACND